MITEKARETAVLRNRQNGFERRLTREFETSPVLRPEQLERLRALFTTAVQAEGEDRA